jgi:hypothetical protein
VTRAAQSFEHIQLVEMYHNCDKFLLPLGPTDLDHR